jgi:hypothetical protein
MPPQQAYGLFHFFNKLADFCAHYANHFQSIELAQ